MGLIYVQQEIVEECWMMAPLGLPRVAKRRHDGRWWVDIWTVSIFSVLTPYQSLRWGLSLFHGTLLRTVFQIVAFFQGLYARAEFSPLESLPQSADCCGWWAQDAPRESVGGQQRGVTRPVHVVCEHCITHVESKGTVDWLLVPCHLAQMSTASAGWANWLLLGKIVICPLAIYMGSDLFLAIFSNNPASCIPTPLGPSFSTTRGSPRSIEHVTGCMHTKRRLGNATDPHRALGGHKG